MQTRLREMPKKEQRAVTKMRKLAHKGLISEVVSAILRKDALNGGKRKYGTIESTLSDYQKKGYPFLSRQMVYYGLKKRKEELLNMQEHETQTPPPPPPPPLTEVTLNTNTTGVLSSLSSSSPVEAASNLQRSAGRTKGSTRSNLEKKTLIQLHH